MSNTVAILKKSFLTQEKKMFSTTNRGLKENKFSLFGIVHTHRSMCFKVTALTTNKCSDQ